MATKYIDAGYEAIHWEQVVLMGHNDKDWSHWFNMLGQIREYAKTHARRHFILNDAHGPDGDYLKDGVHLLDFNSFPLRLWEKEDEPMAVVLPDKVHVNSIYKGSKGGITPSGWECESLPYLVVFDNSGEYNPGVCGGPNKHGPGVGKKVHGLDIVPRNIVLNG